MARTLTVDVAILKEAFVNLSTPAAFKITLITTVREKTDQQ